MKAVKTLGLLFVVLLFWPDFAHSQSWQSLTNSTSANLGAPFLLTDGTVVVQDYGPTSTGSPNWVKLTPDQSGSYVNGTWSQVAALPAGYAGQYYASAVLADGRLVIIGGEYNITATDHGSDTNLGAIYDPRNNTWTPLLAPSGWTSIGDSPSAVLLSGKFFVGDVGTFQFAVLDPVTLTWTLFNNADKNDVFSEEGLTLLPDGSLLAVDIGAAPDAERYLPSAQMWVEAGSTPVALADRTAYEIGPAVLLPNGTVFAIGATGNTAVYTPPSTLTGSGSWAAGPVFPNISGVGQLGVEDGAAVLLPDGNVLVGASPGVYQTPTYFFEYNGTNLNAVVGPPGSPSDSSYFFHLLLLPTGQVLSTVGSAEIYTPAPGSPNPAWAPTITSGPTTIGPNGTYVISGTQFNGLSQAVAYGDDYQAATNYPLVRITNIATGHVFYARTHDHSTMAVATGTAPVSTNFDVPANVETGPSNLVVVANGIPSPSWPVTVVTLKTSATAVSSSLSPSLGGQSVTFTAAVTGPGGTPTGTVKFYDGVTLLGSGALNGSGMASFLASSLIVGSHSITAQYGSDPNFASSTSTALTQVVSGVPSTAVLVSSLNPSPSFSQLVTFTATVTGAGGTPTGLVTFLDGGAWLGSGALNGSGTATLATRALDSGSHSITAQYSGDTNFASDTSNAVAEVVNSQTTHLVVTSSLNPSASGQSVTLTATLNPSGGTGTMTLFDGSTSIGTGVVPANGVLSFTKSSLALGSHSITAQYSGDYAFGSSISNTVTQVVNSKSSATGLTSSLNPSVSGQAVTFTATVTSTAGGTPTGTVAFLDGATTLGTSTLNASGVATLPTSTLAGGPHSIAASYGGDTIYGSSTSNTVTQSVLKLSASALSSALNPSVGGQSVTFTATVTSTSGGTPTGTVTFYNGATSLGSAGLNGSGVATFSTNALAVGTQSITGSYGGDTNYNVSTSSQLNQLVNVAGFAAVPAQPPVTAGQSATINLTVYQAPGSNLTFALTCLGLPAKSTCQFNNNSVDPGQPPNGTTVQLTFGTQSSKSPTDPSNRNLWPWGTAGIFSALAALLAAAMILLRQAPQRRLAFSAGLAVVVLAAVLTGCSGGSSSSPGSGSVYTGTPKGASTFTVSATSGGTTISTPVTVTVQ